MSEGSDTSNISPKFILFITKTVYSIIHSKNTFPDYSTIKDFSEYIVFFNNDTVRSNFKDLNALVILAWCFFNLYSFLKILYYKYYIEKHL